MGMCVGSGSPPTPFPPLPQSVGRRRTGPLLSRVSNDETDLSKGRLSPNTVSPVTVGGDLFLPASVRVPFRETLCRPPSTPLGLHDGD